MAFGTIPNVLDPTYAVGLGLTPERSNYLDSFDFTTADLPQLRNAAIEKYDNTLLGFISKFASTEMLTGQKYIWSELETKAVTYDDGVLTVGANNVFTRAASANVHYRLHEKVQLQTADGEGVFIVTAVNSATSVNLGTYDAASEAIISGYAAPLTAVYSYSLGIEVGMGSSGDDFTTGIRRNYSILDNRPAITREIYSENGSAVLNLKWVEIDGQYYWMLPEIADTRDRFLEAVEKKHIEGDIPSATSDAAVTLGLQGTQGLFSQISDRGANWGGYVETESDLTSIIKYFQKVQGSGVNMLMSNIDQLNAFDTLAHTFNSSYGGSAVLSNFIGDYNNSALPEKVLNLSVKGFTKTGYTFLAQPWKYLTDATFRGNEDATNLVASMRVNFLMVPIGTTPVHQGDSNLATNPVINQMNYLTKLSAKGREYDTWTTGGAWIGTRTNGDDSFKVHFLNESLVAAFNAEKFIIGKGDS